MVARDLVGQVALVTGASSGLGRATALALAEAGADVALLARSAEDLQQVAGEIRSLGRSALVLPADLAEATQVQVAVELGLGERLGAGRVGRGEGEAAGGEAGAGVQRRREGEAAAQLEPAQQQGGEHEERGGELDRCLGRESARVHAPSLPAPGPSAARGAAYAKRTRGARAACRQARARRPRAARHPGLRARGSQRSGRPVRGRQRLAPATRGRCRTEPGPTIPGEGLGPSEPRISPLLRPTRAGIYLPEAAGRAKTRWRNFRPASASGGRL